MSDSPTGRQPDAPPQIRVLNGLPQIDCLRCEGTGIPLDNEAATCGCLTTLTDEERNLPIEAHAQRSDPPPTAWQPIATCPEDAGAVLVYDGFDVTIGRYTEIGTAADNTPILGIGSFPNPLVGPPTGMALLGMVLMLGWLALGIWWGCVYALKIRLKQPNRVGVTAVYVSGKRVPERPVDRMLHFKGDTYVDSKIVPIEVGNISRVQVFDGDSHTEGLVRCPSHFALSSRERPEDFGCPVLRLKTEKSDYRRSDILNFHSQQKFRWSLRIRNAKQQGTHVSMRLKSQLNVRGSCLSTQFGRVRRLIGNEPSQHHQGYLQAANHPADYYKGFRPIRDSFLNRYLALALIGILVEGTGTWLCWRGRWGIGGVCCAVGASGFVIGLWGAVYWTPIVS